MQLATTALAASEREAALIAVSRWLEVDCLEGHGHDVTSTGGFLPADESGTPRLP